MPFADSHSTLACRASGHLPPAMQTGCCCSTCTLLHAVLRAISSLHADRLLLQRLRKSQSGTALYGEGQAQAQAAVVEEFVKPSVYSAYEGAASQRLIVVANRLPVSAVRERDGSWSLQVRARLPACPTTPACTQPLTQLPCFIEQRLPTCLDRTCIFLRA